MSKFCYTAKNYWLIEQHILELFIPKSSAFENIIYK